MRKAWYKPKLTGFDGDIWKETLGRPRHKLGDKIKVNRKAQTGFIRLWLRTSNRVT